MEFFAKIIKAERLSKQFWRYTFLDIQTSKEDWFINNYRISYIPNLAGKLELAWDNSKKYKLYQLFKQDIVNLTEKEEEELFYSQERTDQDTKRLAKDLVRKKKAELMARQITKLRQDKKSWDWIADFYETSKRNIRRKRKPNIQSLQKTGRRQKMDKKDIYFLLSYLSTKKATLKEMVNYLYEKREKSLSVSTVFLTLKRIKYSYQVIAYRHPQQKQNLAEVIEFMERVNELPPRQLLATDESGHPLNLATRKGWGLKGQKITAHKPSYGTNYSLLLVIRNVKNKGVIHWELIKGSIGTDVFHEFLANMKIPIEEKHYLLLDNIAFHKSTKIKELLEQKNIEPRYIVASNPYLNPTELLFNVIKGYVKKQEPRTKEELEKVISGKISELQKEDLTKYFRDCLDFDFVFKNGQ